jgi:hypothetical protein
MCVLHVDGGKLDLWDVESCINISSVKEHEAAVTAMWVSVEQT